MAFETEPLARFFLRINSVLTKQTSDDCYGPRIPGGLVWLMLCVKVEVVVFHFSADGNFWRFVQTLSSPRMPSGTFKLGLAAQAPTGSGCEAVSRTVSVSKVLIPDFRNGS